MLNAETIYQKVRQLDAAQLQEVMDFTDFILHKGTRVRLPPSPVPIYRLRPCRQLGAKLPNLDNIAEVLVYAEGENHR